MYSRIRQRCKLLHRRLYFDSLLVWTHTLVLSRTLWIKSKRPSNLSSLENPPLPGGRRWIFNLAKLRILNLFTNFSVICCYLTFPRQTDSPLLAWMRFLLTWLNIVLLVNRVYHHHLLGYSLSNCSHPLTRFVVLILKGNRWYIFNHGPVGYAKATKATYRFFKNCFTLTLPLSLLVTFVICVRKLLTRRSGPILC
jgi:hypothetical protein